MWKTSPRFTVATECLCCCCLPRWKFCREHVDRFVFREKSNAVSYGIKSDKSVKYFVHRENTYIWNLKRKVRSSLSFGSFFCIVSQSDAPDFYSRRRILQLDKTTTQFCFLRTLRIMQWFSNFLRSRTTWCFFNVGVYTPGVRRT